MANAPDDRLRFQNIICNDDHGVLHRYTPACNPGALTTVGICAPLTEHFCPNCFPNVASLPISSTSRYTLAPRPPRTSPGDALTLQNAPVFFPLQNTADGGDTQPSRKKPLHDGEGTEDCEVKLSADKCIDLNKSAAQWPSLLLEEQSTSGKINTYDVIHHQQQHSASDGGNAIEGEGKKVHSRVVATSTATTGGSARVGSGADTTTISVSAGVAPYSREPNAPDAQKTTWQHHDSDQYMTEDFQQTLKRDRSQMQLDRYGNPMNFCSPLTPNDNALIEHICSTFSLPNNQKFSELDQLTLAKIQAHFREHKPACPQCGTAEYVKFRYFNNKDKSSMVQPRYICKNPMHSSGMRKNFAHPAAAKQSSQFRHGPILP